MAALGIPAAAGERPIIECVAALRLREERKSAFRKGPHGFECRLWVMPAMNAASKGRCHREPRA